MRRFRNWILSIVALVALAAGIIHLFMPQPVPADFASVERGPLLVTIDEEAKTRVREVYVVSIPLTGLLKRIERHAGDSVQAGESILAVIQPTDPTFLDVRSRSQAESTVRAAEAATALADAEVLRARAQLQFARADLERARRLAQRGTISERALEQAELEVSTREAALINAEAALRVQTFELETARAALIAPGEGTREDATCCVTIRAAVSGKILRVIHESEGVVLAGTPLLEIGDPEDLEIVVELLSADALRIDEGAPVFIEEWGGSAVLNGRVSRVEPYAFTKVSALGVEEQRVKVMIDFVDPVEDWRALGHGFRVQARIVIWRDDDVLKLPVSALFREGADWAVFVASNEGRAVLRKVEIGRRNGVEAQVLAGLSENEAVVLHPSDRIEDGVRIEQRPAR